MSPTLKGLEENVVNILQFTFLITLNLNSIKPLSILTTIVFRSLGAKFLLQIIKDEIKNVSTCCAEIHLYKGKKGTLIKLPL